MARYTRLRMAPSRMFSAGRRMMRRARSYRPRKKQMTWIYVIAGLVLVYVFFKDKIHSMLGKR